MSKSLRQIILSKMGEIYDNVHDQIKHLELAKDKQTVIKNACQAEGDLRENEGYHTAMEALQRMEMQLKKLHDQRDVWSDFKTKWSDVEGNPSSIVQIGSLVRFEIKDLMQGQNEWEMLVVPSLLGNTDLSALSITSKVGAAVLGKKIGNRFTITSTRYGNLTYEIISIK